MASQPQTTLNHAINCVGVGLHTGAHARMTLRPAPADHGVVFRRIDVVERDALVPAEWSLVARTAYCSAVENADGVSVSTVEHLMAALAGLGVDNALVELDGPEVPAMDGSSAPFVGLIESAGLAELEAPRRAIRILRTVRVEDGAASAEIGPGEGFEIDVEVDFSPRPIGHQAVRFRLEGASFRDELCEARTFGFLDEVEKLRAAGLALGGSLENAVVMDGTRVVNREGLRFADEFARHKALDALGDLYLAGAPFIGRFRGRRCGHTLNNRLLRALFADPSAFEWIEAPEAAAEYDERPARAIA